MSNFFTLNTEMPNCKLYFTDQISFEDLMAVKADLKESMNLEPILGANLDYAMEVFGKVHPACLSLATLLVSSDSLLVKVCPQFMSGSKMRFVVTSEGGRPVLRQQIICEESISPSDIKDMHFVGHKCQDQSKACQLHALDVVGKGLKNAELRIQCNKLFLTYTVSNDDYDPENFRIIDVKTNCKLVPDSYGFGGLLRARCWLQEEKPEKKDVIACLDYLLEQLCMKPNAFCGRTVLQVEGEMVEIFPCHTSTPQYIFSNSKGVSMYPPEL